MGDMTALPYLRTLQLEDLQRKHPTVPPEYLCPPKLTDTTANGLTRCIIEYLRLHGDFAERVSPEGRVIDTRKTVTDVVGMSRTIGGIKRIKSSMTRGTADISAVIRGKAVKIEIKIGKDKMSAYQLQYKENVERAGGVYLIARNLQEFHEWYQDVHK